MMYGKHYRSMYEGSMMGAGAVVFAVWGYVISHMEPHREMGAHVEINPKLLAVLIGEREQSIREALGVLMGTDKESRSKDEEGRRLVKVGEYGYRVVNGAKYLAIRNEEERRAGNAERQRKFREKQRAKGGRKGGGVGFKGETAYLRNVEGGGDGQGIVAEANDVGGEA